MSSDVIRRQPRGESLRRAELRLPERLWEQVEALSVQERRSVTALIVEAVRVMVQERAGRPWRSSWVDLVGDRWPAAVGAIVCARCGEHPERTIVNLCYADSGSMAHHDWRLAAAPGDDAVPEDEVREALAALTAPYSAEAAERRFEEAMRLLRAANPGML